MSHADHSPPAAANTLAGLIAARTETSPLNCYQCGRCAAGCFQNIPGEMDLSPTRLMRLLQLESAFSHEPETARRYAARALGAETPGFAPAAWRARRAARRTWTSRGRWTCCGRRRFGGARRRRAGACATSRRCTRRCWAGDGAGPGARVVAGPWLQTANGTFVSGRDARSGDVPQRQAAPSAGRGSGRRALALGREGSEEPGRKRRPVKAMGYYPGCSLSGTAAEYGLSLRAVAERLDVELREIPGWVCCGATSAHAVDREAALSLAGETLCQAALAGMEQVLAPLRDVLPGGLPRQLVKFRTIGSGAARGPGAGACARSALAERPHAPVF
jgi:heterodisulfide reductase subunit B2